MKRFWVAVKNRFKSGDKQSQSASHEAGSEPTKPKNNVLTTVIILIAAPLVALFLTAFVFQSYQVDGPSMENALQNNDRLIIYKLPRTWAKITGHAYLPHRGDIIVFTKHDLNQYENAGGDKQLIKRVIGLPSERVVVKNGKLIVYNDDHPKGFEPDKVYDWGAGIRSTTGNIDVTVPDNEIFVCGDNRPNSLDSRTFGTIPVRDIVGKLEFRIFPLGEAKKF